MKARCQVVSRQESLFNMPAVCLKRASVKVAKAQYKGKKLLNMCETHFRELLAHNVDELKVVRLHQK